MTSGHGCIYCGRQGCSCWAQAAHPPIGSYTVTRWATQCEKCGATIDEDYHSATAARKAWDNLRSLEGAALCDDCWPDPDEATA